MYKVFVENKPIIFISKNDLSTETLHVFANDVVSIDKDLRALLKAVDLKHPLYVVGSSPKDDFERLFRDYVKIEAAGGLVQRKSTYLIIERNGLWDIPKGKIDEGELPEEACLREIEEECGIIGHTIKYPLIETYHTMKWDDEDALKKTYWFMLEYNGVEATFAQHEEGITKAEWMTEEQMFGIRERTYGSINDVLDAYKEKR